MDQEPEEELTPRLSAGGCTGSGRGRGVRTGFSTGVRDIPAWLLQTQAVGKNFLRHF